MQIDVTTLGEELAKPQESAQHAFRGGRALNVFYTALNGIVLTTLTTLPLWWLLYRPDIDGTFMFGLAALVAFWLATSYQKRARSGAGARRKLHPLLANDQQGFMWNLRLDEKTVIFDGSNIYHFGLAEGLGPRALDLIARQLRAEGYRVVCFFDANIFYTLGEHGDFPTEQRHALTTLERLFGLRADEIYVVPAGVQADKYILDSLKHLPISFAVTNDRFRDYGGDYPSVMKGSHWRKGVVVSENQIKVLEHRFTKPVYVNREGTPERRQKHAAL